MSGSPTHIAVRPEWLALRAEEALDPHLPIIDAHHHIYDRPGARYLLDDLLRDLDGGHDIRATVFVQARAMLRKDAPPHLQSLGETEFVNGVAAMSASGIYGDVRVCAGIVGYADFRLGDAIRPILERHVSVAGGAAEEGGRFRGARHSLTWDPDGSLVNPAYPITEDLMDRPSFRAAFAHLAPLGLTFDAWVFFHQLPRLTALARAFPETPIVVNHCGGVIGIQKYGNRRDDVYREWKKGILQLASCPNVRIKLSGLGMRLGGFGFEVKERPPSSIELADAWAPWIEACIEAFDPNRCMYGSNFPVDKGSHSHSIGLNALKRLVIGFGAEEKASIFWRCARDFYRIPESDLGDVG
jgi:L-fuconolactonase